MQFRRAAELFSLKFDFRHARQAVAVRPVVSRREITVTQARADGRIFEPVCIAVQTPSGSAATICRVKSTARLLSCHRQSLLNWYRFAGRRFHCRHE